MSAKRFLKRQVTNLVYDKTKKDFKINLKCFLCYINLILFFLLIFIIPLYSQGSANNTGSTGSAFLTIGVGARAIGMGGAFGAVGGSLTALSWNPSGIAELDGINVSIEHNQWVAEMRHSFGGVLIPLTEQFKVGVGVIYFTSGDIEITTIEQPKGTGDTYSASDIAIITSLGWKMTPTLSVGASLKYIQNNLYTLTANGICFDFGTKYNTQFYGMTVALSVSNLGAERSFTGRALDFSYTPPYPGATPIQASYKNVPFSLPLMYRAGIAINMQEMFEIEPNGHLLIVASDLMQPYDGPEKLHLGAEYSYEEMFYLRSGYIFNADELGFSAGVGIRIALASVVTNIDYTYSALQRFPAVHRIGLTIGL